jgi:acetylcholinesterase
MPSRHLLLRYVAILLFMQDRMGVLATCQKLALASAILSNVPTVKATTPINLPGYGSFIGTSINQTLTKKALPAPVDAWLGIDYASPPTGDRRFAPASPPAAFYGTKNATEYGLSCVQDPADHSYRQSEACLSMNVFRPQHVTSHDKVPVLIWIHGVSCACILERHKEADWRRVDSCLVAQGASTGRHL